MANEWIPDKETVESSNISKVMNSLDIADYTDFFKWAAQNRKSFWEKTTKELNIVFAEPYSEILDLSRGLENACWYQGAKMNIAESCFQAPPQSTAVQFSVKNKITEISYSQMLKDCRKVAASLT